MTSRFVSTLVIGSLACAAAQAATTLFDFETDAELQVWHDEGKASLGGGKTLTRDPHFATSGSRSLRVSSPRWLPGLPEWPSFECQPPIADWSAFDRLVVDITNPTATEQKLFFFLSDSKVATRDGILYRGNLPPRSWTQAVVDLRAGCAEKKLNPADLHVMHVFTERPPSDMTVYVDRVLLLAPGEPLPSLPATYRKEFAGLLAAELDELRDALAGIRDRLRPAAAAQPGTAAWLEPLLAGFEARAAQVTLQLQQGTDDVLTMPAALQALRRELARTESLVGLRLAFEPGRTAVQLPGDAGAGVVVGVATSMEKVLPRGVVPALRPARRLALSLARGERESLQLVVLPLGRDLKQVSLRPESLQGPAGATLAAAAVRAVPVGYTQTKSTPPYGSDCVGWWPDPILDFLPAADVAAGDAQAFWVRVTCPRQQAPGAYAGRLQVLVDGQPAFAFDLTVRVRRFAVPSHTPLPLAITFWPMYYEPDGKGGWREGEYRDTTWRTAHAAEWADFLADYYLSPDSLYSFASWAPDFDNLQRLHAANRLGRFNLGYYGTCGETPADIDAWRKKTVDVLRPRYEKARELGLLDHAYIYGCDEHPEDQFPGVERAAAILKQEFPGALVLTTTYDHSFGTTSAIKAMDAFCPLTPRFDPARAATARAAGKQVWWYICCGPTHPHANTFIEYPAIEARLLMGAMTAKYRPDGFLYYQTSIWNAGPITGGPFTDWDPRSWTTFHGDGSWTCLGPGSTPLATVRLENVRDGLEDYAYAVLLEAAIRQREAEAATLTPAQRDWLAEAQAARSVPETLVKSLTEYSRDPTALYAWRDRVADLLDRAGLDDLDPWAPPAAGR